ncbi:1-acyl-sn-glycerol-3-phosphate acyltransferase [bacterium SCSIO 12741]|nr:1-acyl-sn-glycerol-3-phosphate acyltransferase [bacterium SCSIO 12741]
MSILKQDAFGTPLMVKRLLIIIFGMIAFPRLFIFNRSVVKGMENLRNLPDHNVLFVCNHQTYFMDVVLMYAVFSANKNRTKNLNLFYYALNPILNFYYVAALETMRSGILPKLMSYTGAVTIKRTWREAGKSIKRKVDPKDLESIFKALDSGWVTTFPQGTTKPYSPGRRGTAFLIKHQKPIVVPLEINGFRRAFNKSGLFMKKRRTELTMVIKEPLELTYEESSEEIMEKIMNQIGQSEEFYPGGVEVEPKKN